MKTPETGKDIGALSKTPEEIKRDAETCMNHPYMESCNSCRLYKDCHGISDHIVKELYDLALHYESRIAQVERERDAAVEDLRESSFCGDCFHYAVCAEKEPCASCLRRGSEKPNWKWRGVCPENSKEET